MYEVEIKVRTPHKPVRSALADAGAERIERVRQADTYYDAPHRDFAETDEALRLRVETREGSDAGAAGSDTGVVESDTGADESDTGSGGGDRGGVDIDTHSPGDGTPPGPTATTRLTYKGPLVDESSKTREEHEIVVGDGDSAAAIFGSLGFDPAATVEKERSFYDLDGYTVTLDTVAGLGEFVEVEAEVEDGDDVDRVREGAFDVLRRLDLDPSDQIRTSYLGLLLDAGADT
jgi:adenylate cyclase class 2